MTGLHRARWFWLMVVSPTVYVSLLIVGGLGVGSTIDFETVDHVGVAAWLGFTLVSLVLGGISITKRCSLKAHESPWFRWTFRLNTLIGVVLLAPIPLPYVNMDGMEVLGSIIVHAFRS